MTKFWTSIWIRTVSWGELQSGLTGAAGHPPANLITVPVWNAPLIFAKYFTSSPIFYSQTSSLTVVKLLAD